MIKLFEDIYGKEINLIKLDIKYLNDMWEYSSDARMYEHFEFGPQKSIMDCEKYLKRLIKRSNGINADRIKSGLLNSEMIKNRSKARGISEDDYMSGNLLKSEVYAKDVSKAFLSLVYMEKTTGAILSVDGGNVAAMVR